MSSNVDWHDTTTYLASSRAAARPIPLPAPVMAATRPSCRTGCMPSTGAMGFSNWRDAPGRRGEADGCRLPLTLSDMVKRRAGGRWRRRGSGNVGRRRRQAGLYSSMTLGGYISASASLLSRCPAFFVASHHRGRFARSGRSASTFTLPIKAWWPRFPSQRRLKHIRCPIRGPVGPIHLRPTMQLPLSSSHDEPCLTSKRPWVICPGSWTPRTRPTSHAKGPLCIPRAPSSPRNTM